MGLFSKLFRKKNKALNENQKSVEAVKSTDTETTNTNKDITENSDTALVKEQPPAMTDVNEISANSEKKEVQKTHTAVKKTKNKAAPKSQTNTKSKLDAEKVNEEAPEQIAPDENKKAFTGKFEINRSKDGKKFFFNLFASNKVGIATSQMYSSAQSALTGVKSVIVNAPKAPIEDQTLKSFETLPNPKWEIYLDNGNKYRFRLNATNGSCVCHSQGYTAKASCKNGIDSIIRTVKSADIDKSYLTK